MKNYSLIRKSSGKRVRFAPTRAAARAIKKAHGFKLAIVNNSTGMVVR